MNFTRPIVRFFVWLINANPSHYLIPSSDHALLDMPYRKNGGKAEKFDLFFAEEAIRKDRLLIDIHGGGYHGGTRKGNHEYASLFLKQGYDVLLADYPHASKHFTIHQQVEALQDLLMYLYDNRYSLHLTQKNVFLTGDSAGGHFALLLAEWIQREKVPFLPLKGVLINCPVYDFAAMVKSPGMSDGAKDYFYGKEWRDDAKQEEISPRKHIADNRLPLFVSSSSFDFLRSQFLLLQEDAKQLSFLCELKFIQTENKKADHVHNITRLSLPESKEVNEAMLRFMDCYSS